MKEDICNKRFYCLTEVEEKLIDAISNFLLWYTTEEDRGIVENYILEDDTVDYNEWFKLKKGES